MINIPASRNRNITLVGETLNRNAATDTVSAFSLHLRGFHPFSAKEQQNFSQMLLILLLFSCEKVTGVVLILGGRRVFPVCVLCGGKIY